MQKDRLKYLLDQYSGGKLSGPELSELEDWYHQLNHGTKDFEGWLAEKGGEKLVADQLYDRFEHQIHQRKGLKSVSLTQIMTVAAAVMLILSAGLYFYRPAGIDTEDSAKEAMGRSDIKPGGNKATLTLADGRQINLDSAGQGYLANTEGIKIKKLADGQVLYEMDSNAASLVGTNTITTPRGGQYQVMLADGTRVFLNSASSLTFPTAFDGKQRKVELSGEAYFEVSANKRLPFLVVSQNQTVKVLGTHFNIKAYAGEPIVKTSLVEGSVMVSSAGNPTGKMLVPGQQAVYDGQDFRVDQADLEEVLAWKEGFFRFRDEDIHSIMKQLSRWYDVDVVYTSKFENKRFGGYVSRSKNISELLDIMESTKGIHFKIEGRRITVMK